MTAAVQHWWCCSGRYCPSVRVISPSHVDLLARSAGFLAPRANCSPCTLAQHRDRERLLIGICNHLAGPYLPALIARTNAHDSGLVIEIRIGSSDDLLLAYDRRELDVIIVRFHADRSDGQVLVRWETPRLCRGGSRSLTYS